MILMPPLHCETQATWENLFCTVPVIKLRMFGGYIFITGASTEAKTQVFVLYFLISQINIVWKFILIRYGNSFY